MTHVPHNGEPFGAALRMRLRVIIAHPAVQLSE
jgi:hypothetical protein